MPELERSYTTIDKAAWGAGPWESEPDKVQWIDPTTGYDCLAVRHPSGGHWCGYVGLPPEHPCHGVDYGRVEVPDEDWGPEVHGGLTFDGLCQEGVEESKGVCHVPASGRPDRVWWLGFDCAHLGDLSPGHRSIMGGLNGSETYKTLRYVRSETAALADQLTAATPRPWEADEDG